MAHKKKISVFVTLSVLTLLGVVFFFYARNVNIYEPVRIDFSGISASDKKNIKLYSISPLNRQTFLMDEVSRDGWDNFYFYHKKIGFIIPDSLLKKITAVNVIFGGEVYKIKIPDLVPVTSGHEKNNFELPKTIRSKFSLVKIGKLLLHVSVFRYFLMLIVLAIILLITIQKIVRDKNMDFKTRVKRMLPWIKTMMFSVIIALGIVYGYLLFKFSIASYMTSILLIIFVMLCLWALTKLILKIAKAPVKAYRISNKILIVTGVFWFGFETIFRILGINQSYNEKNGLYYASGYKVNTSYIDPANPEVYSHPKYATYVDKRKEFAYPIKSNNEGLRDVDHPVIKPDSEYRIICLGNSFTEGIGAPQDSTWPRLLEHKLANMAHKKISVFNAGISSSDPFFEYKLLEKKLLKYSPDLVLLAPGTSDFEFYKLRGGFERFTSDGIRYHEAPNWEKLYAASYVLRFFINNVFQYKNLLPPDEYEKQYFKAQAEIYSCIKKFKALSEKQKFGLILVFIDDRSSLYAPMISKLKKENKIPLIDLFEYNSTVVKITAEHKNAYYWSIDGHCNGKGYNLYAEGILWNFNKMGIIDSINSK